MPRFAKTHDCPPSQTLQARAENRLSPLAARVADSHLASCEFCRAELALLSHAAAPEAPQEAPAMPLALRLFAESQFASLNAADSLAHAA
jgi:hypothetical protein